MKKDAGATTEKKYKCKLCPKTFLRAPGLGSHMRSVHGVAGMAKSTVAAREKIAAEVDSLKCPECPLVFTGRTELGKHRRFKHGVIGKYAAKRLEREQRRNAGELQIATLTPPTHEEKQIEKKKPEIQVPYAEIDPLLFAYSVGQIKEQCRRIAEEHDVPTKLFTRQFAELFLREARR